MSEPNSDDGPNERVIALNCLNRNQFRYNHQPSRIDYQTYRYSRLLNLESKDIASAIDPLSLTTTRKKRLRESIVLNTKWTEEEKEKFFTALARCGKGNLQEISRRVGTKSLVEVTAYVDLLSEETIRRKESKRQKVFDLRKVPAAVEVDEKWLVFEEKMASNLAKKGDIMIEMEVDQDMVLDIEKANELAKWYQNILAPSASPTRLSSATITDLNNIIYSLTKRLLRTISFLVLSQSRNAQESPNMITIADVRTAVDLLSLPRHFAYHFTTLPSRLQRMNVSITGSKRNRNKVVTSEKAEEILSRVGLRRRSDSRHLWPEKWDRNHGFKGDYEPAEEQSPDEGEDLGFDLEIPRIPEEFRTSSFSPRPKWYPKVNNREEEDKLLEAEEAYLDEFDQHLSQIEWDRLNRVMYGGLVTEQTYNQVMESFPDTTKSSWDRMRKKFIVHSGYNWASYDEEVNGLDSDFTE